MSDKSNLAGYGCLLVLVLAGVLGGGYLFVTGVGRIVQAGRVELRDEDDARALEMSLEAALARVGAGSLAGLIAAVSLIVMLKELAEDASRRDRGAVRPRPE